jgi:hypothetical protein
MLAANARFGAAQSLVAAGRDRARAIALVREAHDIYVELGVQGEPAAQETADWLAEMR